MSLTIYEHQLDNRMIMGTALYSSLELMQQAITQSETQMLTIALKRQLHSKPNDFWNIIKFFAVNVLPNTAGCRTVQEAVTIAEMSREIFSTNLIKLELIGDDYTLHPNVFSLLEATEILFAKGFNVLSYCTDDIVVCKELVALGCKVLMPLAAPIGSGQGLRNPRGLQLLRERFSDISLIVDAGIGTPSDAVKIMEMGYDGILLNSAIALADDPIKMAQAFSMAVTAGRLAYRARRMPGRDFAVNSTPLSDTPFWQQIKD